MDNLPVNVFDLGLGLGLVVAALIGLAVGFVRGGLYVLSWIGAILATLYGFPIARPWARNVIQTPWLADLAAGAGVFVATLIVLTIVGSLIGGWVRGSRLNAVDRSLGMLAALATALLIVFAGYAGLETLAAPEKHPRWLNDAKSLPLVKEGAARIKGVLPKDLMALSGKAAEEAEIKARKALETQKVLKDMLSPDPQAAQPGARGGYTTRERRDMERLIDSTN